MNELLSETIQLVQIPFGGNAIDSELHLPVKPVGVAVLPHECATGHQSPRNRNVARLLRERGFGTLLMDCNAGHPDGWIIDCEDADPVVVQRWLDELARRVVAVAEWLKGDSMTSGLPLGYLGSGLGAAAALISAADRPDLVRAVVAKGTVSEKARGKLRLVTVPTLFVLGARDGHLLSRAREALNLLGANDKELRVVPGATAEFSEPGTLNAAALHAANWFERHLANLDRAVVGLSAGSRNAGTERGAL